MLPSDKHQDVKKSDTSFVIFQRFCLLLLFLHGETERVKEERIEDYLKGLNVYQEILNVQDRVEEEKFAIKDLLGLVDKEAVKESKLQNFINCVVLYAEARLSVQSEAEDRICDRKTFLNSSQSLKAPSVSLNGTRGGTTVHSKFTSRKGSKEQSLSTYVTPDRKPKKKVNAVTSPKRTGVAKKAPVIVVETVGLPMQ